MQVIPLDNLLFMLIPVGIVWFFYSRWIGDKGEIAKATVRMVIQLFIIGYVLVYLFENNSSVLGVGIISFMIFVSSWIALRNVGEKTLAEYLKIVISIGIAGVLNLCLVLFFVVEIASLYEPRYVIPLAGMIFANAMNVLSLASERFEKERKSESFNEARKQAFKAALIPQVNAFLAVGLVSLPGMMTGQILSGVDPLIAVRYQIVVMGMVLGSAGMSVILYMFLKKQNYDKIAQKD